MQKNKNTNQFFFKKANKNANIILYEIAVQPNASHHLIHRYIAIMTNKIAFADVQLLKNSFYTSILAHHNRQPIFF